MRKFIFCLISFLLIMPCAYAMDLSFETAVEKIVAESNDLKSAQANVQKAKAQLDAVNANRWMSIDGTISYMNLVDPVRPFSSEGIKIPSEIGMLLASSLPIQLNAVPDNIFSAGVKITQPIYTFGKIGHAVDAVHDAIDMSESAKDLTLREVRYAAANL